MRQCGKRLKQSAFTLIELLVVIATANNDGAMRISLPIGTVNGAAVSGTGPFNNGGNNLCVVTQYRSKSRLATILDGTSNTLMIGEKHIRPRSYQGKNEDGSIYESGNGNNMRRFMGRQVTAFGATPTYDPADAPNPIIDDPYSNGNGSAAAPWPIDPVSGLEIKVNQCFGSRHPGVSQFVLCDGSVRPLNASLPTYTLTLLGLPDDNQPLPSDW